MLDNNGDATMPDMRYRRRPRPLGGGREAGAGGGSGLSAQGGGGEEPPGEGVGGYGDFIIETAVLGQAYPTQILVWHVWIDTWLLLLEKLYVM